MITMLIEFDANTRRFIGTVPGFPAVRAEAADACDLAAAVSAQVKTLREVGLLRCTSLYVGTKELDVALHDRYVPAPSTFHSFRPGVPVRVN
jgi:hypothetical protein